MRTRFLILFAASAFGFLSQQCHAFQNDISYSNAQLTLINNVRVATLEAGVVESVCVRPGDVVEAGQVLVHLNHELFAGRAATSALSLQIAEAEFADDVGIRFSKKSAAVSEKLLMKSQRAVQRYAASVSETEIDRLRLERDQAKLSIEQAEIEKEVAGLTVELRAEEKLAADIQLKQRRILSPIAGMVVESPFSVGEAVSGGEMVARVIDVKKLRVKAFFSADYALQVQKGGPATFTYSNQNNETTVEATIVFVSPEVRASEKVFEVWADVDNSDGKLLPGFKGELTIPLAN